MNTLSYQLQTTQMLLEKAVIQAVYLAQDFNQSFPGPFIIVKPANNVDAKC